MKMFCCMALANSALARAVKVSVSSTVNAFVNNSGKNSALAPAVNVSVSSTVNAFVNNSGNVAATAKARAVVTGDGQESPPSGVIVERQTSIRLR